MDNFCSTGQLFNRQKNAGITVPSFHSYCNHRKHRETHKPFTQYISLCDCSKEGIFVYLKHFYIAVLNKCSTHTHTQNEKERTKARGER